MPPQAGTVPRSSSGSPIFAPSVGREAEVAGERKLEPAAEAIAEQGGDRRLVHALDRSQDAPSLIENRLEPTALVGDTLELLEVHTDGEVLLAGGGEYEHAYRGVVGGIVDGLLEGVHVFEGHAVERWIVVDQCEDTTVAFEHQGLMVGHRRSFASSSLSPRSLHPSG